MQMQDVTQPRAWTWADQVSSYRLWGLLGAWLGVCFSQVLMRSYTMQLGREVLGYQQLALVMSSSMILGILGGLVLGWLLVRGKTVISLLALVLLLGVVLPLCMMGEQEVTPLSQLLRLGGNQMLAYVFLLAVPAIVAGGRGGSLAFASVFAVALMARSAVDLVVQPALQLLHERGFELQYQLWSVVAMAVAAAFLLPLLQSSARSLFNGVPRDRHAPLEPRRRNPVGFALWVGLLHVAAGLLLLQFVQNIGRGGPAPQWQWLALACAVTGLVGLVIWNYRLHGEVAHLAPSPELLTPRAAAWICVFMPLAGLLLPVQLGHVLNNAQRARISMGWLVFWSLLLPPVAMARLQQAVNQCGDARG